MSAHEITPRQGFLTRLTAIATMTQNFDLSKEILSVYENQLLQYGYARVNMALDRIISGRNSRDPFPSVKEIKIAINPALDPDQEAAMIASSIVGCVSKIGPYRPELAKAAIGDIGWMIVTSEGGWENLVQALTNENMGTLKAQWRNLAKAYLSREEAKQPPVALSHNGTLTPSLGHTSLK